MGDSHRRLHRLGFVAMLRGMTEPVIPPLGALVPAPTGTAIQNPDAGLTAKQIAFCDHYARYRNATQAYTAAYDTNASYETRRREGHELIKRADIQAAIKARSLAATAATGVDVGWLLNHFLSIATADPRELIGLKVGCCRFCYGEGHGYQWREREYLEEMDKAEFQANAYPNVKVQYPDIGGGFGFNATHPPLPECPQCHGEGIERFVPRDTDNLSDQALLLYGGVKAKKDGYEIIIADRQKAAELVGRILGAFNDKVKISGAIGGLMAVADMRNLDPIEASKAYRALIDGHLTA